MKAIRSVFVAAAIFCAAALLTSCGSKDSFEELFAGTYNQWYKYKGSQNSISLGSSEDDSEAGKTLKNVEVFCKFNPASGLTIAVQASTSQNIDVLGGIAGTDVKLTTGGKKEYSLEQFNQAKWIGLYTAVPMSSSGTPKIISSPDECILLDNLSDLKIQWKKVLAKFLLTNLLGE